MSASSPSRATELAFALAAILAVSALSAFSPFAIVANAAAATTAAAAMSPVLPDAVRAIAPQLEAQGEGNQRWFGLLVYRARLWSMRGGWKPAGPFALEIRYAHSLRGADIAKRSIDEMQHIGVSDSPMLQRWQSAMQKLFPDVRDGDVLIGLATAEGQSRFFLNGEPIGQIDDPGFTAAFFGIWLSPKTSAPGLRRELLGVAQ